MPQLDTPLDPQAGDFVNRDKVTGGDIVHGDKAGSDIVRGNKYVTIEAGPRPTLYINVPLMPDHFLGREELVEALVARLCAGQTTALSADGLPGVGKTTLAVALARDPRILAHFREGVLWAGLGRTPDVASVQATWAEALGAEIRDLLDPYARLQRINNSLGDRRLLLVLDDVWQWEAAAQLRCSGPQVITMLTTRDQAIARRFAGPQQSINVPVLATEPGYALLYALAPEACDTDPATARRLAATVDGLPLVLELLGGYLGASSQRRTQARRQQALSTLDDPATRLALATQRLGDPQRRDVTLQATIALSLADLPAATVAAFHALGAFAPKPARFDLPAALAVTQADEETLFTLADRNLVELDQDETLALHQTLADLARTQMPAEAIVRHRDHYLTIVDKDHEDWQRIEAIYPQVSYAWERQIATQSDDEIVVTLADSINTYQDRRGLRQDEIRWLTQALAVVEAAEDQRKIARSLNNLGAVYDALGEKAQALAYYKQALPLSRQVGDTAIEASTLNNLGAIYFNQGELETAQRYFDQVLVLQLQVGDRFGEVTTRAWLGMLYAQTGNREGALQALEAALALAVAIQSPDAPSIQRWIDRLQQTVD